MKSMLIILLLFIPTLCLAYNMPPPTTMPPDNSISTVGKIRVKVLQAEGRDLLNLLNTESVPMSEQAREFNEHRLIQIIGAIREWQGLGIKIQGFPEYPPETFNRINALLGLPADEE